MQRGGADGRRASRPPDSARLRRGTARSYAAWRTFADSGVDGADCGKGSTEGEEAHREGQGGRNEASLPTGWRRRAWAGGSRPGPLSSWGFAWRGRRAICSRICAGTSESSAPLTSATSPGASAGRPAAPSAASAAERQSQPAATSPLLMCARPALQWAMAVASSASRRIVLVMLGSCRNRGGEILSMCSALRFG